MKLNGVSLLKVDEDSFSKTKTGLFKVIQGNKFDKYSRIAICDIPSDATWMKKGQKVIFHHTTLDFRTTDFENHPEATTRNHMVATDKNIVGYYEGNEIKSKDRIICVKTEQKIESKFHTERKQKRNILKVIFSPFKDIKEGDTIHTRAYGGYAVHELNLVFLEPKDCILVNGKAQEGFNLVKKIEQKDFEKQGSIYLKNPEHLKYVGELEDGTRVQFLGSKTRSYTEGEDTFYLVQDKNILARANN